jgi:NAD(P)-dependent dehydrogenase (short-subunit alcohol dehydrogenase family)
VLEARKRRATKIKRAAVDLFGRLDVLVNNAGGSPDADAATVSPRFVERIVALNLLAPFYVAQAANAVIQGRESGGAIVNIGSVSAHDPSPARLRARRPRADCSFSPVRWPSSGHPEFASTTSRPA